MHLQRVCVCVCVLDFEVKHKEEVEKPHGLSIDIPIQNRDQPVVPDVIPVESGSVLRQKNEIEMKYGSSPRPSKLSPDHSLCPPSVAPSDTARLTPTLDKYCTSDILSLTDEVPEGFLDDDDKDAYDCSWQKRHQNDSSQPSPFLDQNLSERDPKQQIDAGSLFQRSFSYRENCQPKQSKTPFFNRSASLRLRGLSDTAKSDNAMAASGTGFVAKTNVSAFASFSSTEVCRRLLKGKNQHNVTDKLCDPSSESTQVKHADKSAEKKKQVLLRNVFDTVQLPSQQVPSGDLTVSSKSESCSGFDTTNCNYSLHHSLKTNTTKSVILPVVSPEQTRPTSAFVSKMASQQFISHSSGTELSAEASALTTYLSVKDLSVASDVQPSSTAGSSDCRELVAGNTAGVDVDCCPMGDRVLESTLEASSGNNIQSQSTEQLTQVDASGVDSEPASQSFKPLPSEQVNVTSSSTQLVGSQPQSDDTEQCQLLQRNKRFSFRDKSASFILTEPETLFRSKSVRDKSTSSFLRHATGKSELAEVWKVKKPYGKSHPLSKLSSDYFSRNRSTTVGDSTCDHDTT